MFAVETYAAVPRFVFIEGKSRRGAPQTFWAEPGYDHQDLPLFGVVEPFRDRCCNSGVDNLDVNRW